MHVFVFINVNRSGQINCTLKLFSALIYCIISEEKGHRKSYILHFKNNFRAKKYLSEDDK